MLATLQRLWLIEAAKYNVLPLDDRTGERLNPELAGRPTLIRGNTQLFFSGMGRLSESSVVSMKNKSFSVTAEIDVPEAGAEDCHRPRWALRWMVCLRQGWQGQVRVQRARYPRVRHRSGDVDTVGHAPGADEFAYDGGGLAKGGDVTLYYDGTAVGRRVGATQPMIFSADETTDIGYESGTTVTPDYTAHTSRFTGKIHRVQLDVGVDDNDHFIDPEERFRIAMARQ